MTFHRAIPARVRSSALLVAWLAVLGAAIHLSQLGLLSQLERRAAGTAGSAPLIPSPAAVKALSLGYDQLLADIWWLAFIQYFGDYKARLRDHNRFAYAYLDLITQLDPKFIQAYWFTAFSVGSEARRPDQADRIIRRGMRANQDNWYLPFIAGANQYLFAHNDAAAARYYRQAARYPGAPAWLSREADILQARLPTLLKEIKTWDNIYCSTGDKLVKREAARRLVELWTTVYKTVPSPAAKKRAVSELKAFGVDIEGRQRGTVH